MLRRLSALALTTLVGVVLASSCASPTKITLDVRTNVTCTSVNRTEITADVPGAVEHAKPNLVTSQCDDGAIGTLVLTPASEADSPRVAIKVVLGVDVEASTCNAANQYHGCIVQRRVVSYLAHDALVLPIDLLLVCLDVPCDEESTCAANGECVSARIADPESCVPPRRCSPEGTNTNPSTGADGGRDAAPATPVDASTDANADATPPDHDAGAEFAGILCGNAVCRGFEVCCVEGALSRCILPPGGICTGAKVLCDGPEDCLGNACCYNGTAACSPTNTCGVYDTLCHSNLDCPLTRTCTSSVLGGAFKSCQ